MKILFVQKTGGIAGSELYHLKILPALIERGIECEFVSVYKKADRLKNLVLHQTLADFGVKVHQIQIGHVLSPKLLRTINQILVDGEFTILHSHLVHADFWGSMIKLWLNPGITFVSTKHGYDEKFQARHGLNPDVKVRDLYYWLEYLTEKCTDRSAFISAGLRNLFLANGLSSSKKIELIPYGFDFLKVNYDTSGRQYRYSRHQLIIVGRLIPFKGHRYVLDVLPELVKEFPDLCLVIVGSGPSEQELKEQVKLLGLSRHVRFEGYQAAIHDYLRHSDVCVIPSTSEGFCAVILEAWHNCKPVVAFDVPAINTSVVNGLSGYLVTPFDRTELKERLARLLHEPELRQAMGEYGNDTLKNQFSLTRMIDDTISFYRRSVGLPAIRREAEELVAS